jgi:hypothetical protein
MRTLVLSKLAIEDSQMVSMDETMEKSSYEPESCKIDFADTKPTPEEVVLEKEIATRMDVLAGSIIDSCRQCVRNKPQRFRKLIEVVWHCYFNHSSASQTAVAKLMGISDSLVSHYRKIFDASVRREDLTDVEYRYLNSALDKRISELLAKYKASGRQHDRVKAFLLHSVKPTGDASAKYLVGAATNG